MARAEPWKGKVRIFPQSGLRKRMRAARRGKTPDEVAVKMDLAMKPSALRRHKWFRKAEGRAS